MKIIQEVKYDETMKTTVEPYLKQRCISGYTDSYDAVAVEDIDMKAFFSGTY